MANPFFKRLKNQALFERASVMFFARLGPDYREVFFFPFQYDFSRKIPGCRVIFFHFVKKHGTRSAIPLPESMSKGRPAPQGGNMQRNLVSS
ncbi:MAG: hypothetical protein HQL95_07375 [Magnetococcales bacterium]|nr:hypothetical protein [Magnetococcales bacterium]